MKSKARTSRRRVRKPRFLSLRRQLATDNENQTEQAASPPSPADEGNVADRFFAGAEGCANSLTGLLQPKRDEEELVPAVDSPMSSVSAAYDDARSLVRAAMRSRREEGEEEVRWVRMSEVQVSDEASSRAVEEDGGGGSGGSGGGLALKLDYKEVEEAWDKGRPFFSWPESEGPQIVPDLSIHNDFFYHHHHNLNAGNGVLWGVPDQKSCIHEEGNGEQSIEGWRLGQREASVLRYKEKRMNRLFSKRIRYQVRKLNAEKRPRVKGRFVKRS
ncbi:hypothetical protein V2J09_000071 [Rumex salicifolius]